jgi:large subunit ribosomal protein L29
MKASVIRELSTQELLEKIEVERAKYHKLRMTHSISALENPMEIKHLRKTIARLNSELRGRQLQQENI